MGYDAYKNSMGQFKDKIGSGQIAVADTLPMQLDDLRAGLRLAMSGSGLSTWATRSCTR